jgi:hypothetical protein
LSSKKHLEYLTRPFPAGVHFRPLGGADSTLLYGIWTYNVDIERENDPPTHPEIDEYYGEAVLRGTGKFISGMKQYFNSMFKFSIIFCRFTPY